MSDVRVENFARARSALQAAQRVSLALRGKVPSTLNVTHVMIQWTASSKVIHWKYCYERERYNVRNDSDL